MYRYVFKVNDFMWFKIPILYIWRMFDLYFYVKF